MITLGLARCSAWVLALRKTLSILLIAPLLSGCGLAYVNGPPAGWEQIQDVDDLEIVAIVQSCTTSKTTLWLDVLSGAFMGITGGLVGNALFSSSPSGQENSQNFILNAGWTAALGVMPMVSAHKGNQKVNDCKAFNAHLMELRRKASSPSEN